MQRERSKGTCACVKEQHNHKSIQLNQLHKHNKKWHVDTTQNYPTNMFIRVLIPSLAHVILCVSPIYLDLFTNQMSPSLQDYSFSYNAS